MAESTNALIGHETRSKSVLGFVHDIVLLTARRLDEAAKTNIGDDNAVVTPHATKTWEGEFVLADRLTVSPVGGNQYMVYPQQNSFLSNRVNLTWGDDADGHHYDCTCDFCPRFKIPCRHVLAVAKSTETANRALELISKGYSLATYRAAANDSRYRISPPVWNDLTANPNHRPPLDVQGVAGRPKAGPRKRTRIQSNGEMNTSSRTYAIYNANVRANGGVGVMPTGGGAAGGQSNAVDLSQGASQGAP
ncbi:unnamed protein product [Ectocarpus fasciculatus]